MTEQDPTSAGGDVAAIPGFDAGGRVERTGIALVHEGEYIVPAADSEAVIAVTDGEGPGATSQVINYHFPVEIEVIGDLGPGQLAAIARYIYDELDTALHSAG